MAILQARVISYQSFIKEMGMEMGMGMRMGGGVGMRMGDGNGTDGDRPPSFLH